jgi:hypothetical protein
VVVPVAVVGGVPVPVVHIVGVIVVGHRDVTTSGPVLVLVSLMGCVPVGVLALIHVVGVYPVDVAIVGVVGVIAVRHGDVAAALAVGVRVIGVGGVLNGSGHAVIPSGSVCRGARRAPGAVPAWHRAQILSRKHINI